MHARLRNSLGKNPTGCGRPSEPRLENHVDHIIPENGETLGGEDQAHWSEQTQEARETDIPLTKAHGSTRLRPHGETV